MEYMFSPKEVLEPHLQCFQPLDRIRTFTIDLYDTLIWRQVYNVGFTQFYPTLTTLALRCPTRHYRFVPQFVLQLPNLENLTFESPQDIMQTWLGISIPPVVSQSPPLRGRLRCASLLPGNLVWTMEFAFDPLGSINFRSLEFRDVYWKHDQHMLYGYASSLKESTAHVVGSGEQLLRYLFCATNAGRPYSGLQDPSSWDSSNSRKK